MKIDLRKLKQIYFFDKTFILKIDDGITVFCNADYTVGTIKSDIDNEMFFEAEMYLSYEDLVYLWEAGLWYIAKRADNMLNESEYKFYSSMTRYIRMALSIRFKRMAAVM
jgi:hypothetical protein